ncbi:hypothetical protein B0H17DRAFT_992415 [Mycena rosella]|uniref:Mucoidy inhibitor A n=1 Tax=Mycena rosella TaxID=1033263 RepID=A0AAD7G219_MYCRO|nr:hypothetical protein B0H17DRAFT_992415 [Mycena rosella]
MTTDHPPAFEATSTIELQSIADSKITGVSLYPSRAEVTRLYKFAVKTGQNQVQISGLPNLLEVESLRVEGRGAATIHDVTVSRAKEEHVQTSSPELTALLSKRERIADARSRCKKSLAALEQYLNSLTIQHLDVSKLESVMDNYDSTGEKLESKKSDLTEQLRSIDADIARARIDVPKENERLRMKAVVGVFAQTAGDVEIALIYAVPWATWTAFYDIRVDMSAKEDSITLNYRAAITQNTGESWEDVPLMLETSTPTFGIGIPRLTPWNLEIDHGLPPPTIHIKRPAMMMPVMMQAAPAPIIIQDSHRSRSHSRSRSRSRSPRAYHAPVAPAMEFRGVYVASKGNVSASFRVPGLVSIPSDGEAHNFTIVKLNLQAAMSWVCVPKLDTKAHINAKITNASEYTLLGGKASVYVDGSFISRTEVPPVSPKESFDCPLGVDPSIRITYHPVTKKLSRSGFYTKSANYVFSQRITVFNTKTIVAERVKIIDQIPMSQNSQIEVKLTNPALTLPSQSLTSSTKPPAPQVLNIARGVTAQWDGVDEPDCELESLGVDRKLNWLCSVPSQGKINLALEWEVTVSPARAKIIGL